MVLHEHCVDNDIVYEMPFIYLEFQTNELIFSNYMNCLVGAD